MMELRSGPGMLTTSPVLSPERHLFILQCIMLGIGTVHMEVYVISSLWKKQLIVMFLLKPPDWLKADF